LPLDTVRPWEVLARDEDKAAPEGHWVFSAAMLLLRQPVDAAISLILQVTGEAAGADRAWMFEYDAELLRFRNTHEWRRRGVPSFVQDLQNAPVTMIGWLHQYLVVGKAVMINHVEALPRTAGPLRAELLRQGNKSVLSVPLLKGGRLVGCIGFDSVHAPRRWSIEVDEMFRCADLIVAARHDRVQAGEAMNETPDHFESLIYLRRQGGVRGTPLASIVGLRSSRDYTEVWLADGSMVLDQRPLIQWLGLMPQASFLRIHRTAIVNHQFVRDVERRPGGAWQLRLNHMTEPWPVSRSGRTELRMRLGI
jgi:hypothetical protein